MKRICEIYDISKEYEMPTGTVLIIVSDIEKDKIISMLLSTKMKEDMVFNNTEWQEYLEINNKYNRNEAKHQMREIRQSKRLESDISHIYEIDIGESLENEEIEMYLKNFLLNLKPVQRRRFKMYYIDNLTYRQIADIEKRNIKSIYESVQAGKKKFLKYLDKHPNKFKFMKGHPFVQLNTHSSDTFLLLCKAQAALSITPRRISRATNNRYKFRTATETAITGSRYNDTPAQSQVERDKTVATNESSSDELGEVKLLWSLLATDRLMISF